MAAALQCVQVFAAKRPLDIDRRRQRRTSTKRDPLMNIDRGPSRFWEATYREFIEDGKRALQHAEWLKDKGNMYALTNYIAANAAEWQRNNKDEAMSKDPILKAIGDEINKQCGSLVTDAYTEDMVDYSKYMHSPLEDPEEEIDIPGPRATNGSDRTEITEYKGKGSGPCWRTRIKRKDIVWLRVYDKTQSFRMV